MLSYPETLEYLYSRLPMYQRVGKTAYKKDLNNTWELMEGLKNPHEQFRSVHIAGTNGKGTSAHAIAAILQEAGYKVGLYTSPHLKSFTERIRINGQEMEKEAVVEFVAENLSLIEEVGPSFFEVTVAMAFDHFRNEEVDIAVIETGLGGRLDSTNVITPLVSLITNIGLEHTDLLGNTIEKIAAEKAGIVKNQVPVVVGADMVETAFGVIEKKANELNSRLTRGNSNDEFSNIEWPPYFTYNIPGVLGVVRELQLQDFTISKEDINQGLKDFQKLTGLKGRFQKIGDSPMVVADVSHNADGLSLLFDHVNKLTFDQLHVIFGTVKDKDLGPILTSLPKNASFYFTQSSVPRSLSITDLQTQVEKSSLHGGYYKDVNGALDAARKRASESDLILITGSTFVVAELDIL